MKEFGAQNVAAMNAVGTLMTPDRVGTLQLGTTLMTVPTQAVENLVVLLSNAEQALRRSSGTNAPLKCWGCQGIHEDDQHLFRDCPRKLHLHIQANLQKNLQEYIQKKRAYEQKQRFDPNNWKKDGFASPKATSLFNGILDATNATSRHHLVAEFVYEHNSKLDVSVEQGIGRLRKQARLSSPGGDQGEGGGPPLVFPFWLVQDDQNGEGSRSFATAPFSPGMSSYQVEALDPPSGLCYPISSELPHVVIPIGRNGEATIEGLLDTRGACTMGDLTYWREVAGGCPHLIAQFEELSDHQEKPISIGGVGAGKVEITHIMGIWLPWLVGDKDSKLVIGLGENMPVTLLIGLPFQIATQCVMDVGQLKCHSVVFNSTWKLTLKVPQKKTIHSLDATVSSPSKSLALTTSASPTKKICWQDLEVVSHDQDQE
jgi:hypothetical protein